MLILHGIQAVIKVGYEVAFFECLAEKAVGAT
jgi:hypothetical protein